MVENQDAPEERVLSLVVDGRWGATAIAAAVAPVPTVSTREQTQKDPTRP